MYLRPGNLKSQTRLYQALRRNCAAAGAADDGRQGC